MNSVSIGSTVVVLEQIGGLPLVCYPIGTPIAYSALR
jgi:hypothetical protein